MIRLNLQTLYLRKLPSRVWVVYLLKDRFGSITFTNSPLVVSNPKPHLRNRDLKLKQPDPILGDRTLAINRFAPMCHQSGSAGFEPRIFMSPELQTNTVPTTPQNRSYLCVRYWMQKGEKHHIPLIPVVHRPSQFDRIPLHISHAKVSHLKVPLNLN